MKHNHLRIGVHCVAALAIAFASTSAALARPANQMTDLVGARGSSGEAELESRGFTHIATHAGNYNTKHAYWWHRGDKNCLHVETYDGRYTAITDASRTDCNQTSGNAAAAAGVVAGAALLGALLSKKHHRDNQTYDETKTADFERGYRDGLYNASYHNYDRSDAYAHGYSAGTDERNANLAHRDHYPNRGGYNTVARISDLNGARGSSADDSLRDRGFRNVDNFSSGNTLYGIWTRRESHQCVQVTIADGRVYDIRDIGTHPRC